MAAGGSRQGVPPMMTAAQTSNRIEAPSPGDVGLSFAERAFSAVGAAVLSAVVVNPLDVAKTRIQAQAAGVPYQSLCESGDMCPNANALKQDLRAVLPRSIVGSELTCTPDCGRYKGTMDVFYKVIRQEGIGRLWRGTNASLALAVPTVGIYMPCYDIFRNSMEEFTTRNYPALTPYVPLLAGSVSRSTACIVCYPLELARTRMQTFTEAHNGMKRPGVWKTLAEVVSPVGRLNNGGSATSYRILWTGLGAQLARDVPFSAICWSTLEPIRRRILSQMVDDPGFGCILGANFSAGVVAGSLAAALTCPLDVAKTRRQIEMDPTRALKMTTMQTLLEIWRDGGIKGLFMGINPRVVRAGPSVGIVVSFYEVVKYSLHRTTRQHHHQPTNPE